MPDQDRDAELQAYSDRTWNAHAARWRDWGSWPEDGLTKTRVAHEEARDEEGNVWGVWFIALPDGTLRIEASVTWFLDCMRSWDVRLMAWEVEESQAGRRVVWLEREKAGAQPSDLTVGYLHGGEVTYQDMPSKAILPPPPEPGMAWQEEYRAELLEHIALFGALDKSLNAIYREAKLSLHEEVALDARLHGGSIRSIAADMHQRGGGGRERVERWIESAIAAIKEVYGVGGPPLRVSSDGLPRPHRPRGRGELPRAVAASAGAGGRR